MLDQEADLARLDLDEQKMPGIGGPDLVGHAHVKGGDDRAEREHDHGDGQSQHRPEVQPARRQKRIRKGISHNADSFFP